MTIIPEFHQDVHITKLLLTFSHIVQLFRLIYVNFLIMFDVPAQWTVLGLFLSQDEQIWCLHSIVLDLSTVPVISGWDLSLALCSGYMYSATL